MSDKKWNIELSNYGKNTTNPLVILTESEKIKGNPEKYSITMRAGDPSVFGNFPPHPNIKKAMIEGVSNDKFTYSGSQGYIDARQAVAEYASHMGNVTAADVFLTSCCSMAVEVCIKALINPGENILLPRPCWHYITYIYGLGIETQFYNLDPLKDWQIDLVHLESLINDKTRAIVVNSPGNPCGNVFNKQHMLDIIDIAERHQLPIISDEIYEFFTFPGVQHYSFASLSKNVPILVCSGLTKRFLIPNVRTGWIIISDRDKKLEKIREGLVRIGGMGITPNSSVQHALPNILKCVPQTFFDDVNERVHNSAMIVYDRLSKVPGLKPIMPRGSMYLLLGIDLDKFPFINSSMDFMELLIKEQSVYTFPSESFHFPGFLRLTLTVPTEILIEACNRIKELCEKHCMNESSNK